MKAGQRGFTLIEILVALVVLAVLAVAAYGGLDSIMATRKQSQAQDREFGRLQLAMATLTRDLEQASTRPVRYASGDHAPAMQGGAHDVPALAFTHAGLPNPLMEPRSGLERVAYEVDDGKLVRLFFPVLDQVLEMTPERQVLLPGVNGFGVRFLDGSDTWQQNWPPLNAASQASVRSDPVAVEITLDTKRWGAITRLVEIAP